MNININPEIEIMNRNQTAIPNKKYNIMNRNINSEIEIKIIKTNTKIF